MSTFGDPGLTQMLNTTGAGGVQIRVDSRFVNLQSLPRGEIKITLDAACTCITLAKTLVKIIFRLYPRLTRVITQKLSSTDLLSIQSRSFAYDWGCCSWLPPTHTAKIWNNGRIWLMHFCFMDQKSLFRHKTVLTLRTKGTTFTIAVGQMCTRRTFFCLRDTFSWSRGVFHNFLLKNHHTARLFTAMVGFSTVARSRNLV